MQKKVNRKTVWLSLTILQTSLGIICKIFKTFKFLSTFFFIFLDAYTHIYDKVCSQFLYVHCPQKNSYLKMAFLQLFRMQIDLHSQSEHALLNYFHWMQVQHCSKLLPLKDVRHKIKVYAYILLAIFTYSYLRITFLKNCSH